MNTFAAICADKGMSIPETARTIAKALGRELPDADVGGIYHREHREHGEGKFGGRFAPVVLPCHPPNHPVTGAVPPLLYKEGSQMIG